VERVGEREERLRRFSRMITHELKNRVGATLGAGQLLQEEWLGDDERRRFAAMVTENAQEIQKVLENLVGSVEASTGSSGASATSACGSGGGGVPAAA
jgi:nitrogen-specific signal transduction histidine kinase